MKQTVKIVLLSLCAALTGACSMFGNSGVEIAPYDVLQKDGAIELRHYKELVLVTTPMEGGMDAGDRDAFFRLFDYISGANTGSAKIPMTAPVFMSDQKQTAKSGKKIPMTAPVFMNTAAGSSTMSFVLPADMTYEAAPRPVDKNVKLEKISNYNVASIVFSGFLSDRNIQKNRENLESWLAASEYKATAPYMVAGYNPPFTLPMFRRNEVLIPVAKK